MTSRLPGWPLTEQKVRHLSVDDLGLTQPTETLTPDPTKPSIWQMSQEISDDNPILAQVRDLLDEGYAGVILTGPPGTSKSYYAARVAAKLVAGIETRVRFLQFHPSYQYEDFVEGMVPLPEGGFALQPKHLLEMSEAAQVDPDNLYIIVIDELSRTDPSRVFGEALTYVEKTKRGIPFKLASGTEISIPTNLSFIATMNPLDRGVDDLDTAFERRFAKIAMEPDVETLREFLQDCSISDQQKERLARFFQQLQNHPNPYAHIGHAYFFGVKDRDGLMRRWNHQLKFVVQRAFQLNPEEFTTLAASWDAIWDRDTVRSTDVIP